MAQFQRLVTFGDSYTYGEELEDPSNTAWPVLLSKQFNLPLVNLGEPGFSNDGILEKILDQQLIKTDLVVVCFSSHVRMYFEDQTGGFTTVNPNNTIRREIVKQLMSVVSFEWLYKRWLTQVIYLQEYLKSQNISYLFLIANHGKAKTSYVQQFDYLINLIDRKYFIGWPDITFESLTWHLPRAKFGHPLEFSHKVFADYIVENIIKLNYFK